MFLSLIVISLLTDLYIISDILKYCAVKLKKTATVAYIVIAVVFTCAILSIFFLPKNQAGSSISPLMWTLFAVITVVSAKIVYVICSAIGRIFRKARHNYGIYVGFPIALLMFIAFWWGALVTRHQIETVHTEVASDRLPAGFDGLRIVQFSDIHLGTWGNDTTFVSAMVDTINAQHPDVIFFTGDIVNRMTTEAEPFVSVLSRLHAPLGVYTIFGNHDYGDYVKWNHPSEQDQNVKDLMKLFERMNWKLLDNTYEMLHLNGDSIAVIGVGNWGEAPFAVHGDLKKAYTDSANDHHLYDKEYKILLSHNPEHWRCQVNEISNIDLTLSGHTHAMQSELRLGSFKWSPAVFRYKYWGGLYQHESKPSSLYVNIGAGEVGMPARIGAVPEITVITLRKKK